MQVPYGEGVAIRIDPEPCVGIREGAGEASAGEHTGQPLSRESLIIRVPTWSFSRKATWRGASSRVPVRPGVVGDPGMCGSSLFGNREVSGLARGWTPRVRIGKARSRNR